LEEVDDYGNVSNPQHSRFVHGPRLEFGTIFKESNCSGSIEGCFKPAAAALFGLVEILSWGLFHQAKSDDRQLYAEAQYS
jgi:hypothetical protein